MTWKLISIETLMPGPDFVAPNPRDECKADHCLADETDWVNKNIALQQICVQQNRHPNISEFFSAWGYPCHYCSASSYHSRCKDCGGPKCLCKPINSQQSIEHAHKHGRHSFSCNFMSCDIVKAEHESSNHTNCYQETCPLKLWWNFWKELDK